MDRIVECVPNFSEGRDIEKIERITDEICSVEGVKVIHVDPGAATNRTVVTFVGSPEGVEEAAFRAMRAAAEVIDMRMHEGEHPRMGASDVFPFIPVSGISMEECVEISHRVAERVGRELNIPVYLYENSASVPERRSLAFIRSGEYEGFRTKIEEEEWKPDFGPQRFNEKAGCTTMGAREFLIAYNVNLDTDDKNAARTIAERIRESGTAKRDAGGKIIRTNDGKAVRVPGLLKHVRAVGWYIEEYGKAQISINILNFRKTPIHMVYDTCVEVARELGVGVTGSELVGLIPQDAMIDAGIHYLRKEKKSPGLPARILVEVAMRSMGLDDVGEFDPEKRVIEFIIREPGLLRDMSVERFVQHVSLSTPVPGGGSVAALACSLSAALSCMVGNIALTPRKAARMTQPEVAEFDERVVSLQRAIGDLCECVDRDAGAFSKVIEAMKMPHSNDADNEARKRAIGDSYKGAAEIPLAVMELTGKTLSDLKYMAGHGDQAALSDMAVAAYMAKAGITGAAHNVRINLEEMEDEETVRSIREAMERELESSRKKIRGILEIISGRTGYVL